MIFGAEKDKGLKVDGFKIEIVSATEASIWDSSPDSPGPAFVMSQLDKDPTMPRPFGVLRSVSQPSLDGLIADQIKEVTAQRGPGDIKDLLYTQDCWTVE